MIKKYLNNLKNKIVILFNRIKRILSKPYMALMPGQIAFFVILSLVPIITLIGYGASFFNISMDTIIEVIKHNFNSSIVNLIVPIIEGKTLDFKLVIMIIIMFYLSSNGAASVIYSANEICNVKHSSWIKRRLKSILLTLLIVILYIFILLVPVFGRNIVNTFDYFNIKSILKTILELLQGPISWIIIFVFIKVIYTISPNKKIPSSRINLGAVFTTVFWVLTTYLYSYYVNNIARYDLFYAGLSNIAILMLWVYLLSYIFVIGLSLMVEIDNDEEMEKTGSIKIV